MNLIANNHYKLLVKGPKHIQKRICENNPTEDIPGSYPGLGGCPQGAITIAAGENYLGFSNIVLLSGDLPEQNGVVNSGDVSLVMINLGKNDVAALEQADLNLDGAVNGQDYSLVMEALGVRSDEQ